MNLADLSIRRPVFISSLLLLLTISGVVSLGSLPVDLFPTLEIPYVAIITPYPGAGPEEVESAIGRPLEEELSTLEGLKKLTVMSYSGVSETWVEFRLGSGRADLFEQKVRDKVSLARARFPRAAEASVIEKWNPSSTPVLTYFIDPGQKNWIQATEWAERELKPSLIRIPKVGQVRIMGGLRREIHVQLKPEELDRRRLTLTSLFRSLDGTGLDFPAGQIDQTNDTLSVRVKGQYSNLTDIQQRVVSIENGDRGLKLGEIASVLDTHGREKTRSFLNGKRGLMVEISKQSGANSLKVANSIRKVIATWDNQKKNDPSIPSIQQVLDTSQTIRDNVDDVYESIIIGILLTIVVVWFFLGSIRSTLITGLAIPNSLLGTFLLMKAAGFSVNILSLLALSLAVGLLIDDAIVVRENIFKKLESGSSPEEAARKGTQEVSLAVLATSSAILAIFGPVGFLQGVTGQFFREFGLVICFAMIISTLDALTIAPMLSAYWSGNIHQKRGRLSQSIHDASEKLQSSLERLYHRALTLFTAHPWKSLLGFVFLAFALMFPIAWVPGTFLPPSETKEFTIEIRNSPGSNLNASERLLSQVEKMIREDSSVDMTSSSIGAMSGDPSRFTIVVQLKPPSERAGRLPSQIREELRKRLAPLKDSEKGIEIRVLQGDAQSSGMAPFNLILECKDRKLLDQATQAVLAKLRSVKGLQEVALEQRPGSKEVRFDLKSQPSQFLSLQPEGVGFELRAQLEGVEFGKLRELREEYPIKLTQENSAKRILDLHSPLLVPNTRGIPVDLRQATEQVLGQSPNRIERMNRIYVTRITAEVASDSGIGDIMSSIDSWMPEIYSQFPGVSHLYEGDSESYEELGGSMGTALFFGVLVLFFVLASLYESFLVAAILIMALPLAIGGAFTALWISRESMNMYSMIGILLLLGIATKNSILLVDTVQQKRGGTWAKLNISVLIDACTQRLRPILMTSLALIAGTLPIAIGLNEASRQRTSMGAAIIGGTVSSTILSLIVVPLILVILDRVKSYIMIKLKRL